MQTPSIVIPSSPRCAGIDDERERRAKEAGFAYVSLAGEIGVLGNGAGLVMSLLDAIEAAGGRAANFLDVGGGATHEQIAKALEIVLSDDRVRVLLCAIFGGITRCDEVARGLLSALEATDAEPARGRESDRNQLALRATTCWPKPAARTFT